MFDFQWNTWLGKFTFSAYFRKFLASGCWFLLLLLDPWSYSTFWDSYSINIRHFDIVLNDLWGSVNFSLNISHQVLQVVRFLLIHFQVNSFSPFLSPFFYCVLTLNFSYCNFFQSKISIFSFSISTIHQQRLSICFNSLCHLFLEHSYSNWFKVIIQ